MNKVYDRDRVVDSIFKIEKVFREYEEKRTTKAVPFILNCRGLHFDCDYMYGGKVQEGTKTYYCAYPEHIEIYLETGSKLLTCKDCPNYKK